MDNEEKPTADVRALIAWQQDEPEQADLFGDAEYQQRQESAQAARTTAQGRLD